MIKAVVFDWDGTLADTMSVQLMAYRRALRGVYKMSPLDLYSREGKKKIEIIEEFARGQTRKRIEQIAEDKDRIYKSLWGRIKLYPGAGELLRAVKSEGLKLGLVTGTIRRNVCNIMSQDMAGLFDHITTADEVKRAKPHPEPYLRCLQDLGVMPEEALAIENAPLGIQSAKSAGMFCIAISTTLPPSYLKDADAVVKDLKEAEEAIGSMIKDSS